MNNNTAYSSFLMKSQLHKQVMELRKQKDAKNVGWKTKMIRANIPKEFWHITFKNFRGSKKSLNIVKKYCNKIDIAKDHGFGFLFMGEHGVGKTCLQMIILKSAIKSGHSAFYITMSEIFERIYLGFKYPEVLTELYNYIWNVDFLAIGEMGRDYHRQGSELFMMASFDRLFRTRRGKCFPTSLDTNMKQIELKDTYGKALISLFMSRLKLIRVKGIDYRKTIQKEEWKKYILEGNL